MTGPRRPAARKAVGVRLAGTGMAVPDKILTNEDLTRIVETSDEWITQRTGIKTRRIVEGNTKTSDLAAQATKQALQNAGLAPSDLDLLICATMTPDMICPATACQVVRKIGAIPCGAFDINIACTGFVAALNLASNCIASGHHRTVAILGADTLSKIVNWEDRRTCILFGDAASCAILTACDDVTRGSLYQSLGSDAERGEVLYVPRDASDLPPGAGETFSGKYNTLQMDGRAVYKFAVTVLAESVERALAACDLTADDIAMVIPHQSNIRMLQSSWKRLGFPEDKIKINIDRYGNTSAASAGICLHECLSDGSVRKGDYVVFVAQGGGLSWGTNLWRL